MIILIDQERQSNQVGYWNLQCFHNKRLLFLKLCEDDLCFCRQEVVATLIDKSLYTLYN